METKVNPDLKFEFLVDVEKNTITTKRQFAANRQMVWDCYTKSELLDHWFAPEAFRTKTKSMVFSEGGHWHHAMVDAEGQEYWGYLEYQTIRPIENYTALDSFCDESGVINHEFPCQVWDVTFIEQQDQTLVEAVISFQSREALGQVIEMGMKVGMTTMLQRLDELLVAMNNQARNKSAA